MFRSIRYKSFHINKSSIYSIYWKDMVNSYKTIFKKTVFLASNYIKPMQVFILSQKIIQINIAWILTNI